MQAVMQSRVLGVDGGETYTILGNTVTIKVAGEQTRGSHAVVYYRVAPGFPGPPPHRHDFDEYFYLLDGELQMQVGTETVVIRAGESAFAARGEAHTFSNPGNRPATFLITMAPAGFERFFGELAARLAEPGAIPPVVAAELNRAYGVEMVEAHG